MNNLNSVLIEGNLTKDPLSKSIEGTTLSNFAIACNRYYKKDGEQVQEVSYFNVDVWGKTADYCNQYLKKGSGVRVVGRLKQDRWSDQDNQIQSNIKIIAEHVDFFPNRKPKKSSENALEDTGDEEFEESESISLE